MILYVFFPVFLVSLSPTFTKIYSGDTFYLRCEGSASQSGVKWYFNDTEQMQTNETWKIAVATPWHSGSYQCESNRQTSDKITINVLGYAPSASLIIRTGQPVMRVNESVILQLDNEDGLRGWHCEVYRGKTTKYIKLKLQEDSVSLDFQTSQLTVPETIFWCMNGGQHRSNQITVRTSEKTVSLEMYPLPAVVGESLTLRCLVWGTDQISQTTFYKDGVMLVRSDDPTYTIPSVTESAKGRYKCMSIFTYKDRTAGPHYSESSDDQDVLVLVPPMKAFLSANVGMSCSCPLCPTASSYSWYFKSDDKPWTQVYSGQGFMMPKDSGTYACRALWSTGRSYLSSSFVYHPPVKTLFLVLVFLLLVLGSAAVAIAFYIRYRKRAATGAIYEDVERKKGDNDYEMLGHAQREGEYDTLHPEAPSRQKREGEYEALKKEEMEEGVYHTVQMQAASGGGGEYEQLQKEGMEEGQYQSLNMEGAIGGVEGHEASGKSDKGRENETEEEK
uniref:Uncharacterized LOC109986740 n=1 Tax=Labrus bergylta TaxID=56723 RepID=A0A3Q3MMY8_9LABR